MAINPDTTVKKIIYLPKELWREVDDYRFEQRLRSEAEAVRRLIDRGLAYQGMRAVADQAIEMVVEISKRAPLSEKELSALEDAVASWCSNLAAAESAKNAMPTDTPPKASR